MGSCVKPLSFAIALALTLTILSAASAAAINGTEASLLRDTQEGICKLLVTSRGYTCEEHKVTTADGYILSVQRIPVGRSSAGRVAGKIRRIPVLLQHGVLTDGMTWLFLPPSQSLAFMLADHGYDVWIANSRGTKYSHGHVSLPLNHHAYWNWTWDEQVKYDLPAIVGYVHTKTGQKMHFVGHSLGNSIGLAALSKGKLVNMLRSATALCPVAYLGHLTSLVSRLGSEIFLAEGLHWLRIDKFDPKGMDVANLLHNICKIPGVNCGDLMTAITGNNCCLQNPSVDTYMKYEPQPTSMKNMIHISQMVRRGTFGMYDYGNEDKNMKHYGQPSPPDYDLRHIPESFPLFFAYGGSDSLSDTRDVRMLFEMLRSSSGGRSGKKRKFATRYIENFAHADFIMAGAAKEKVYDGVLSFIKLH